MSIRSKVIGLAGAGVLAMSAALVAHYEGRKLSGYLDPVSIPTICYGHTATARLGQVKTQAECEALLRGDLGIAMRAVDRHVTVPLPDTRRVALASFIFNVGEGAFARSTLLRKLNRADARGACAELSRWVYARGMMLNGLVTRRQTERELCEVGL